MTDEGHEAPSEDAAAEQQDGGSEATAEPGVAGDDLGDMEALVRERDELLDTSRRLQADFENYRKRVLREQTALIDRSTEGLVEKLLPVLDAFELAMLNLDSAEIDSVKVRKGVELVYAELVGVLEKAGLSRIEGVGQPFDPMEHEAVLHDDGESAPIVADVMRTGWRLKGRVLRPAMVKVTKAGAGGGAGLDSAAGVPSPQD